MTGGDNKADFNPVRCGEHTQALKDYGRWQAQQNGHLAALETNVHAIDLKLALIDAKVSGTAKHSRLNLWAVLALLVAALLDRTGIVEKVLPKLLNGG
jgi:hypothetical protein